MKKVFSKIVLLLTVVCLLFSITACGGKEPPVRDYSQREVLSSALQNTLKETDIKVRGQASLYIAQVGETVPVTVSADVKNQEGVIDFTARYSGSLGAATVENEFVYKDGILYTPAYDGSGNLLDGERNGHPVALSLEGLLEQIGGGGILSTLYAEVVSDAVIRPQGGVFTLSAAGDYQSTLTFLQQSVLARQDMQFGEFLASFAEEGYTREKLVKDLEKIFDSRSIRLLEKNINALFETFHLPITLQDVADPLLEQMGYTKNQIYALAVQFVGPVGAAGVPKPKAGQTTYEYALEAFGLLSPSILTKKLGIDLADLKATVLAYIDDDACTFGMLWDGLVAYLDEIIYAFGLLAGVPTQITPPFLSCANLSDYAVNTCKGALSMGVDAASMRIRALAFTVDVDIDYGQEKIKAYIDFTGNLTYGEQVSVEAPLRG